jgi:hypothetical protein
VTKLVILIPTSGTVHTGFMRSMIALTQSLPQRGIAFSVKTYEFSDLVMSRNYLTSYFLSQKTFTHALMLDSDLSFSPSQFFCLFEFDEGFTAAVYPDRRWTTRGLKAALVSAQPEDLGDMNAVHRHMAGHMNYIVSTHIAQDKMLDVKRRDGFHTAATVGGGFILVKRSVVEKIVESGQARRLPRFGQRPDFKDAPEFTDFFSHLLTEDGGALLGEDQSFCKRWQVGCGGDIWVDEASAISHIGEHTYHGDYQKHRSHS